MQEKTKQNFILVVPMKIRIGCTSIHTTDHGMKLNSTDMTYILTLKKLCIRL